MDRSRLLKPAGVAVLSVLVGILASIGNEVVLVNLLVVLIGIFVIWKQNQVLYYLLQERNHVVPLHQVPVSKNSKSTKNKHLNEKTVYSESREAQKQETLSNGKNKQSKGKNAYLDNSEVQKKENFSKMESKQPKESSEKLMLEVRMSGMKYTSGYLEMCKYFEEVEDDAVRDKKVRLACELRHQGFDLDKVIDAARNCDNFDTATRYLMQKCDSCAKFFSLPEIVQMFMCTHKLCKGCINNHVAKAVKGRNILDCTCKVCEMPKLEFEDKALEYLSTLDCYLESILPSEIHQQFHRELMSGTWKTRLKSKESKKRPDAMGNKNSVETVERGPAITSTDHRTQNRRDTKTCNDIEPVNCSMCKENIVVNTLSDMATMPGCFHRFCKPCFEGYFNDVIEWDVTMWLCPKCGDTSITDYQTYFKEFANVLQRFLTKDRAEFANTKLQQWFRSQQVCTPNSCGKCLKKFRESELVGMPSCEHRFCTTCTSSYFNSEIEECDILGCYCPFCVKGEDAKSKDKLFEYFTKLGQILKPYIYSNTFQKFQKKLEELRYTDLCIKCYSPVKAPGKYSRFFECQYCSTKACTQCRLLWDDVHYTMSCEEYKRALRDIPCHAHNMSSQPIDCFSCGERFLHVRDGTIMFSCPKCEAQMCRSCKRQFYLGVACPEGKDKCCLLYFHAHHPANCLFYLQNKNVDDLFRLLRERNLKPERTSKNSSSCEVEVKKVLDGCTTFEKCGELLHHNYLGLCKKHAVEFLTSIILKNSLDTKSLLDENDEKIFIKRGRKDGLQRKFYGITRVIEENELALKASRSPGNNSDSQSSSLESSSEKTPISMNILIGKTKKPGARCEDGPEPATDVSSYSFEIINMDQPCDLCHLRETKEKVTKIFGCDHIVCVECIRSHFKLFPIYMHSRFLSCPVCHRPDINERDGLAYLSALSISVKKIFDQYQYNRFNKLLQKKFDLEFIEQASDSTNNNFETGGTNPGSSSTET